MIKVKNLKIQKIDIVIIFLFLILFFLGGFLLREMIKCQREFDALPLEEKQRIILSNQENYNTEYINGTIVSIDNTYYYATTCWYTTKVTVYCKELDDKVTYEEKVAGVFNRPTFWDYKEGDIVQVQKITVTDGYGNIKRQYLGNLVIP